MSALLLVRGGASLRLDEEGFEVVGLLTRSRLRWSDIESIRMGEIRGARVIALNFKRGHPGRSDVSRSLTGLDSTVGDIYNVSMDDLCETMKKWHERYRHAP